MNRKAILMIVGATVLLAGVISQASASPGTKTASKAGSSRHAARSSGSPSTTSGLPGSTAATDSRLLDIVNNAAQLNGGFTPSNIRYVSTSRQAAAGAANGTVVDSNQPVYFVEFDGPVVAQQASVPYGAPTPTGHAVFIVVDQASFQITDWGVVTAGNNDIDLSQYGPVQQISTSGN